MTFPSELLGPNEMAGQMAALLEGWQLGMLNSNFCFKIQTRIQKKSIKTQNPIAWQGGVNEWLAAGEENKNKYVLCDVRTGWVMVTEHPARRRRGHLRRGGGQ